MTSITYSIENVKKRLSQKCTVTLFRLRIDLPQIPMIFLTAYDETCDVALKSFGAKLLGLR